MLNCAVARVPHLLFSAGHDVGPAINMTVDEAVDYCIAKLPECMGFSVQSSVCYGGGVKLIHFKTAVPHAGATTDGDKARIFA